MTTATKPSFLHRKKWESNDFKNVTIIYFFTCKLERMIKNEVVQFMYG